MIRLLDEGKNLIACFPFLKVLNFIVMKGEWYDSRRLALSTQLFISSLQMTISLLSIFMLGCDHTQRWVLQIIVRDMHVKWSYDSCCTRSLKTLQWLSYCYPKRLYIKRTVLLFSRFFMVDPKYLCFDWAKKLLHSKHLLVS